MAGILRRLSRLPEGVHVLRNAKRSEQLLGEPLVLDRWLSALESHSPRVVFADGDDPRAVAAAVELEARKLVHPILVATERRDIHGSVGTVAVATTDRDPLQHAMDVLAAGRADACVAGASRSTSDVLRAALKTIGTRDEGGLVSSSFYFVTKSGETMAFGDCAVVPDPTAEQMAAIAIDTAETFSQLSGQEPRVAMLSFSTLGSARHASVDKVRAATELVRQLAPHLAVDGELQFDAAFVPEVAATKAPASEVAGRANVFIFPNLDAGNIAYKITERLGGAQAFGPLLQGMRLPVHDLSRGCSVDDIVAVATIAAFQTTKLKETGT